MSKWVCRDHGGHGPDSRDTKQTVEYTQGNGIAGVLVVYDAFCKRSESKFGVPSLANN